MYIADKRTRLIALVLSSLFVGVAILAIERPWQATGCGENSAGTPDFCGEQSWINSEPLTLQELDGQVVLVDFWTYTCINCIRTFPHLTELYDTYEPYGLVIVGVHTPEFIFEKQRDNVEAAVIKYGINYPVVQDNDYRIWDNYHNRFWPAHYLMDSSGKVVDTHFGEGGYAETEAKVRELLIAAGATDLPPAFEGAEGGVRGTDITPELYAGYGRQASAIGNPEGYRPEQVVDYHASDAPERDRIYFDGPWHNGDQAMTAQADGAFYLRFHAGAVNAVIVPGGAEGTCAPVRLDGQPITEELAGSDVRFDRGVPCVLLTAEDSFDLYAGPVEEHTLSVDVTAGFELYSFAFSSYAA